MQATRDIAESRKLALAAGDLVTLIDHRWVRDDGKLKQAQWVFVWMKQRLQTNNCFPAVVSSCQDSDGGVMQSRIKRFVS